MKFSTTLVAAFAAVALSAPVEPQQAEAQEVAQGGDQIAFYEDYDANAKKTRICTTEKSQKKKCIEIDLSSGQEEYKCQGADGLYKNKCEEEAEKELIEEYKKKKAFKEWLKKKEFEEYELRKGMSCPL